MVQARKDKGLKTFVVVMAGPEAKDTIQTMTTERKITIPVTFLPQGTGAEDVKAYQINPSVKNTVLLWRRGTVRKGLVDIDEKSFTTLDKAVDEMLQ